MPTIQKESLHPVCLTEDEYQILKSLVKTAGHVYGGSQSLQDAWDEADDLCRDIDVFLEETQK